MKEIKLPTLYARASTGKIQVWKIRVYEDQTEKVITETQYGQLNGAMQKKLTITKEGRNLGRSNATTPWEQAVFEAKSTWQGKVDRKYITEIPTAENEPDILLPMLAAGFESSKHHIRYPAYVQPKLNGVRCLAKKMSDTQIRFTSRHFKEFPQAVTAHLGKLLLKAMEIDQILDGEFYVHGWTFQRIIRTVKAVRPWAHELEFHVFDLIDPNLTNIERAQQLQVLFLLEYARVLPDSVLRFVETEEIRCEADVYHYHDQYVAQGYEGIIIRNQDAPYVMDHRSKHLQKLKRFIDAEFEIIGGEAEVLVDPATLDEQRAIVFTCINGSGGTFNVRPRGSVADRVRLYQDLPNLIGKQLTVRYQEESEDLIPIFPVGIAIRDYE